jgi:predicted phosphodiesterase
MSDFRILAVGDPHFKSDNAVETEICTNALVELVIREHPDAIVILGDILHKHEKIDMGPYCRAEKLLSRIHDVMGVDTHLYILVGNHDRENNTVYMTDMHVFGAFKRWRNTHVVDYTYVGMQKAKSGRDVRIVCVPYVPVGRFAEALSVYGLTSLRIDVAEDDVVGYNYHLSDVSIVFAHQEFMGAKMNAITSNVGDYWPSDAPLCVSGHIHDYDQLAPNLIYTGTPIQHGFADTSNKTVSIYNMNYDVLIESVGDDGDKCINGVWRIDETRVGLGIPKRVQYILTPEELIAFVLPPDVRVKIKMHCSKSDYSNCMRYPSVIELLAKGVKIVHLERGEKGERAEKGVGDTYTPVRTRMSYRERLVEAFKQEATEVYSRFSEIYHV